MKPTRFWVSRVKKNGFSSTSGIGTVSLSDYSKETLKYVSRQIFNRRKLSHYIEFEIKGKRVIIKKEDL